jgi:adenylate cyclase
VKDHAKWAARCALQHLEKLEQLRADYRKQGLPDIDIGIGLNTGEASVGNMGSQTVRNYTVMGDTVNLASRLEGINKTYGTRIIVSEFTFAEIKDGFTCREVDRVRVKGKNKPVKIFELVCEGKPNGKKVEALKHFATGYDYYHAKKFQDAISQFEQACAVDAQDETARIYIERCQEFVAEPPIADWDGVYVMKTK